MPRGIPTVAQLRAFAALARLQHFGEAADELGIAQPTLSQSLATLEANLQMQLVERRGRQVLVTAAGAQLLPLVERAVAAVDAVAAAAAPRPWLTGGLRMGLIPTIAPYLLPAALAALAEHAPGLELTVREDQTARLLDAVRRGQLDVAVVALPVAEPGLEQISVYAEDFVLATPPDHRYAGADDIPVTALPSTPLLLLDEGHCLRDQALQICGQAGVSEVGAGAARAASLATIVQLVAAGFGCTLLPATAVAVESRGASLAVGRFADPAPGRTIGLVFRSSTARAEEFAELATILRRATAAAGLPTRF